MAVNSDRTAGCLGIGNLWISRGHLGASVPKLLRTASETSCSAFPTDGANCGLLNSQNHWIVGAFTS